PVRLWAGRPMYGPGRADRALNAAVVSALRDDWCGPRLVVDYGRSGARWCAHVGARGHVLSRLCPTAVGRVVAPATGRQPSSIRPTAPAASAPASSSSTAPNQTS